MFTKELDNGVVVVNVNFERNVIRESVELSNYTKNTWQEDRSINETKSDTIMGKISENAVERYFKDNHLYYVSYDEIRNDNKQKHAPFDGLLMSKNKYKSIFEKKVIEIQDAVRMSGSGKIPANLIKKLGENGIFTVEIKSTRTSSRHKKERINTDKAISESIINQDDFFYYPVFTRTAKLNDGTEINKIGDYFNYFYKKYYDVSDEKILRNEKAHQSHINIRVYKDHNNFFIIGYITRDRFFLQGEIDIGKMAKQGKSEDALYFKKSLSYRKDIKNLVEHFNKF